FTLQTFLQQVFALMKHAGALGERVRDKSQLVFLNHLKRHVVHLENHGLRRRGTQVGPVRGPDRVVRERLHSLRRTPLLQRMPMLAEEVQAYVRAEVKRRPSGRERSRIHQGLNEAAGSQSLMELYRGFYQWLDREDLFTMKGNVLEYADVFQIGRASC